jgi:rhamnulose-1-phosphate aldolase/alcohol dehydrogenase
MTRTDLSALGGVDGLVERSRAIGADDRLVVHGGGNTSCKTSGADHRGRERPILVIKASGADLRGIDVGGFVALYLDDLAAGRQLDAMDDDAMMSFLASSRADLGPRRPSIETFLHAFLPARHVDHVHADAICALTNGPDPERSVREALGPDVALVAYRRPGFHLAREVAERARVAKAVVLEHHGLVCWADSSGGVLALTRELTGCAQRYLAARSRTTVSSASRLSADEAEALLLVLRGRVSRERRRVLHVDRGARHIADRADVDRVVAAGPSTADHLLRIRAFPIVVRSAAEVGPAVDAAEANSRALWERFRDRAPNVSCRDPLPAIAVVPGLGTVAIGADAGAAGTIAGVARRTHEVAATVIDALGEPRALTPEQIFDLEYWPLELAKLPDERRRDLDGRIVIVTGAASGIGRDVATTLAAAGAHVTLADVDEPQLAQTAAAIERTGGHALALRTDVTRAADVDALVRATVDAFGGIDGVVSNAGVAVTGRIDDLSDEAWGRSLAVNATAHFLVARRVLRVFARQGLGGSLVFVASKNAFSPGEGFGAYSVAKAAEVQLARVVALEAGRIGVRANVVSPDAVFGRSHLWDAGLREERAKAHGVAPNELEGYYIRRSLLGLAVRGSDVAEAALFCLSDRSSRMTGCVLTVDAGVASAFPR